MVVAVTRRMFPQRRWRSMWKGRIFDCLHLQLQMVQIRSPSTMKRQQHWSCKEEIGRMIGASTSLVSVGIPLARVVVPQIDVRCQSNNDWSVVSRCLCRCRRQWSVTVICDLWSLSQRRLTRWKMYLFLRRIVLNLSRQIFATCTSKDYRGHNFSRQNWLPRGRWHRVSASVSDLHWVSRIW